MFTHMKPAHLSRISNPGCSIGCMPTSTLRSYRAKASGCAPTAFHDSRSAVDATPHRERLQIPPRRIALRGHNPDPNCRVCIRRARPLKCLRLAQSAVSPPSFAPRCSPCARRSPGSSSSGLGVAGSLPAAQTSEALSLGLAAVVRHFVTLGQAVAGQTWSLLQTSLAPPSAWAAVAEAEESRRPLA